MTTEPTSQPQQIFLASHNAKKIAEMERILAAQMPGIQVLGLDDVAEFEEPIEDEATFAGNALLKARAGAQATGLPTIADDSGLCVDALNQMPGVLSARWAGRVKSDAANNALLLEQMYDVPNARRTAHFACVIAFVMPDGREQVVEGRMDGRIIRELRGQGGFGYDVLFVPEEHARAGLTSAELTPMEKDHISHRGRALRALAPIVAETLGA